MEIGRKTKLTLTVRKDIIEDAKEKARRRGVSVSRLFEEAFEDKSKVGRKSKSQIAGEKLLEFLTNQPTTNASEKGDKDLVSEYLKKKYG